MSDNSPLTLSFSAQGPKPILIIAQTQGRKAKTFRSLDGWASRQLIQLLKLADINPTDTAIHNILPGGTKNVAPTAVEIRNYRGVLMEAISKCKPNIIITLGAMAFKWFLPKVKFSEVRGRPQEWTGPDGGVMVLVPMMHPGQAAPGANSASAGLMIEDWKRLKDVVMGTGKQRPGVYREATGADIRQLLSGQLEFAFDLETTSPMWHNTFQAHRCKPIGFSVAVKEGEGWYCFDSPECIRDLLENDSITKVCHNLKFETTVLAEVGITLCGGHDTKLMANVLRKPSTHLKHLTWNELGIKQTEFKEVDWNDRTAVIAYGAADSDYTLRHAHNFERELREEGQWDFYQQIELPVVEIISRMERQGVLVDPAPWQALLTDLRPDREATAERLNKLLAEHYEKVARGENEVKSGMLGKSWLEWAASINWASPNQKTDALFGPPTWKCRPGKELKGRKREQLDGFPLETSERDIPVGAQVELEWIPPGLGLPVVARNESGTAPSTNMKHLMQLEHPVIAELIRLASLEKTITQVEMLLDLIQEDGRIHASFHQAGGWEENTSEGHEAPETGRFSSSDPNLQQIVHHGDVKRPYVAEWGHRVRQGFIAPPGFKLIAADFAQQEPRIAASWSRDAKLLDDLHHGDVYCTAASVVFGRPITKARDPEERQIGKRMFMKYLNGGQTFRDIAPWLEPEQDRKIAPGFGKVYPDFEKARRELIQNLRATGWAATYFGRRRYLLGIWSVSRADQTEAARQAIVMPIQGTASDVIKICLRRLAEHQLYKENKIHLVGVIHDELLIEVPIEYIREVTEFLSGIANGILPENLPIEVKIGDNWAEQVPVEKFLSALRPA